MIIVGNIYAGLNQSGGGGTVLTANGLSGDGSAGSPVILGGNSLNQDTTIDGAGFELDITTGLGDDLTGISIETNATFVEADNSGSFAFIQANSVSPNCDVFITVQEKVSGNNKRVSAATNGGLGIVVTDTIDNKGLYGQSVFPISGDPEQYAQYGNLPGAAGNTANGISGNGAAGTPIILGGNPLNQDTVIDALAHTFSQTREIAPDATAVIQDDSIGFPTVTAVASNATSQTEGRFLAYSGAGTAGALIQVADIGAVKLKQVFCQTNSGKGVQVTDSFDNIGLNSDNLYPVSGNPGQYAQYGNIQTLPIVNFSGSALSIGNNFITFNTDPALVKAYRITAALFATVGLGSVQLQITYTSFDTIVRTVNMGPALVATGDAAYPPLTLICRPGTTISVDGVVAVAGVNYDAIGIIEDIGGF